MIHYIGHRGPPRLKVRRIDEESFAENARAKAMRDGEFVIRARHGGSVANSYGYRAETEGVLVIASPEGLAVCWLTRLPANKVTERGVAFRCCPPLATIFDRRCSKAVRDAARPLAIEEFGRHWTAMERLAAAGA